MKSQHLKAVLKPVVGDGTSVLVGATVFQVFVRLAQNLILTRLLTPDAFGVVGIVTAISFILAMMTDLGLRAYIIRHENPDKSLFGTLWTIRLLINIVLAVVMFLGAKNFASLYGNPELALAVAVWSIGFLIEGVASLSPLIAERDRLVARLSSIDILLSAINFVVIVAIAFTLKSYWALIFASIIGSLLKCIASYTLLPNVKITPQLNKDHIRDLWKFSRFVLPSSILTIFLTQADRFFMATFFSLEEMGMYMLAVTLASIPQQLINQYVIRVFFPLFAETNRLSPDKATRLFYSSRLRISLALAVMIGGAAGGSEIIVKVLFDERYANVAFYLMIVMFEPLINLLFFPTEQAIIARGFIRATLIATVLRCVWLVTIAPAAFFFYGPIGLIIGLRLMSFAPMPYFWFLSHKYGLLQISKELLIVGAAILGAAIGFGGSEFILYLVQRGFLPDF